MRTTVEIAPNGPRPAIRIRRVPPTDPPFDDELDPAAWAPAHQLAFDLSPRAEPVQTDAEPARPPVHRSVVAEASSDAQLAVRRFLHLCLEVLNGYRPPAHLRRLSLPAEAANVVTQGQTAARRIAERRRAVQSPHRRPARRPAPIAVIRHRLCEPRPGAVEAAFALAMADRTWAMALRMELHHQTWSATSFHLL